jgi:hypothetical protein
MEFRGYKSFLTKAVCAVTVIMFLTTALPSPVTGVSIFQIPTSAPESRHALNTSAQIESLIYQIDGNLVGKYIQKLQDYKTRYSYRGDRCYPAADYIGSIFRQNGLNVTYDDFLYQGFKYRNVIGEITGKTNPDQIFIICAHYDSVSSGFAWTVASGADDNGSGTAGVIALAEILSDFEFNCTIRFIGFSGEEQGLKGSYHYVGDVVAAGETVSAVLDLDMIGANPNPSTNRIKLFTGAGTIINPATFINEIINTTTLYPKIGLQVTVMGQSSSSDHHPFAYLTKSVMLIEYNFSSYYHSTADTIDKLNLTYCANVTQLAGATIARLAQILPGDVSPPSLFGCYPQNGSYATATSTISVEATDPSLVNISAIEMFVNGVSVTPVLSQIPLGYNISYIPPLPFSDGLAVNITVHAADTAGNSANLSWQFTVDAVPPAPPTNLTIGRSRIELLKRGLAIDVGTTYDSRYAEAPSVIFHAGEYRMWYSGYDGSKYTICYADSADGIIWAKHGIVLNTGIAGSPDSQHAGFCTVMFDGEYRMWYSGYSGGNWRILYANSTDGLTWVKHGVVLNLGTAGSMDDTQAYFPSVIKTGEYRMWYAALDGLKYRILYANSSNGLNWTKYPTEMALDGPGQAFGDALVTEPAVTFYAGEYHMYYGRYDGQKLKTMYARSSDGLKWSELGLAIDAGSASDYDYLRANQCSVIMDINGTKIWYTAYNGANMRIMYADLTPNSSHPDLTLTWTPSTSADVVKYEVFRESRPSAFRYPLVRSNPEFYTPPGDLTPWTFRAGREINATVYGPITGTDPAFFNLPDDNIVNLTLCLKNITGAWQKLISGPDYYLDTVQGHVKIFSTKFGVGCTLYAWYNHSAGKALRVDGSTLADVRAGASNRSYYYVLRAVDRAGNIAYCTDIVGKIGAQLPVSWSLLSNPFIESGTPVSDILYGLNWTAARTWEPSGWPHQWTLNVPGRAAPLNTLTNVERSVGVWVKTSSSGAYTALGQVSNTSISLTSGWNLVSYPYHEIMSVSQALSGVPWDRVEVMDSGYPYLLKQLSGTGELRPGQGLWVHVTSDAVWNAANVP